MIQAEHCPRPLSGKDFEEVKEGAYGWDAVNQGQQEWVVGMEWWGSLHGDGPSKPR